MPAGTHRAFRLPARYSIEGRVHKNAIKQLNRAAIYEEFAVGSKAVKRSSYTVLHPDEGASILIANRRLAVTDEPIDVFRCRNWDAFVGGSPSAGARVDDLYGVCGQAQRSTHWRSAVPELFKHLRRREDGRRTKLAAAEINHVSRFERGDLRGLRDLGKQAKLLLPEFKVFIVQPGLSKKALVNRQLDLLGATELYLMDTAAIPLGVIASE